ncbi:GDP-Man:Man(3)GlcNAc(2)-PP-Dol alpha-1,2-mannosyltransferase [[Candida] anglica]
MYFLVYIGILLYVGLKFITSALPRLFLVPPHDWRDKIKKVIEHPKPIYLKVGSKRSAYRRRLVLASDAPAYYTNFVNNKLKISPDDAKSSDFEHLMKNRDVDDPHRRLVYGFFHPYANNGGGGERVLWLAVQATLMASDRNVVAIYTTNIDAQPKDILNKVQQKFQIEHLDGSRIVFIYLKKYGKFIDANYWKHFTILGQFFGSVVLALEAMYELSPDVWVDTIGLPASYFPVNFILKIPIMSYVHYPVLQPEMFGKLKFKDFSFNSFKTIKPSLQDVKELGKLMYWSVLYYLYVYLGSLVDVTLTNGTWTNNHMQSIWSVNKSMGKKVDILYPPCGEFIETVDLVTKRENKMLYIAQFRPEKRHVLILEKYSQFLQQNKKVSPKLIPSLVFLGSCRTAEDTATLVEVKSLASELDLDVEFVVDCSYEEVLSWLSRVKYGLNAMWNEHFGIGVVEYLSKGAVPLVHASAGPLLDIVTGWEDEQNKGKWHNNTGFFFKDSTDPDYKGEVSTEGFLVFDNESFPDFTQLLEEIIVKHPELSSDENLNKLRANGQKLLQKFSNSEFVEQWVAHVGELQYLERSYRDKRTDIVRVY